MRNILAVVSVLLLPPLGLQADEVKGGESFQIRNAEFGELLRPLNASTKVGAPIVLYPAAPWKCMTWRCVPAGDAYSLQNHFSSKTFAANGGLDGQTNYAEQIPWAENPDERPKWTFTKLDDGSYKIADARTGLVLTAVGDARHEVRVSLESWSDKSSQKWEVLKAPDKLTM